MAEEKVIRDEAAHLREAPRQPQASDQSLEVSQSERSFSTPGYSEDMPSKTNKEPSKPRQKEPSFAEVVKEYHKKRLESLRKSDSHQCQAASQPQMISQSEAVIRHGGVS